jgi:hypothetical protein
MGQPIKCEYLLVSNIDATENASPRVAQNSTKGTKRQEIAAPFQRMASHGEKLPLTLKSS